MTDLADADFCGSSADAPAWPSPVSGAPQTALPPPPASVSTFAVDMPAPLVHESARRNGTPPESPNSITTELPTTTATPVAGPEATPEPTPTPAILTGPAAVLGPATAVAPLDNAAITLPAVVAKPSPTAATVAAESFMMPDSPDSRSRKSKKSGGSRLGKFCFAALLVGGLGYAGAMYGPDLYDTYVADEEPAELAAPLSFPRARTTAPEVRTATFVLDGLTTGSEASYTVTVDFDTRVSRVVIDRTDAPDLEVLTFSNDALVRRLDSPDWYQIERGAFPLDDQLQRTDWIRMIDELVPPERRAGVVIDGSTIATVAGVETRHLVLTLDPALLELVDETGDSLDPIRDIADAAASADAAAAGTTAPAGAVVDAAAVSPATELTAGNNAAVPQPVADPVASPSDRTPLAVETVPVAGEPASPNAIQVELWIDRQGVVRRSVGADVLGANSITILETTSEAWVPDYPDAASVQPMTAAALIELGF